ncbi:MAG: hypothetical protein ACXW04_07670 [Methylobacter sp.]
MNSPSRSRPANDKGKNTLKLDLTFVILDHVALSQTDDQAAEQQQKECPKLDNVISECDLKNG